MITDRYSYSYVPTEFEHDVIFGHRRRNGP